MRWRWATAAAIGLWCGVGLAENLPDGLIVKTPRQPLSAKQVTEQDQIYQRLRKSRYLDGARRVSVPPLPGKWAMPLESMGLVFNADGAESSTLSRSFRKDRSVAWREALGGTLDHVEFDLSVERYFVKGAKDDIDFLTYLMINSAWFKYITPEAHDRMDTNHLTDLARADALFGLTRKDVFSPGHSPNAENMAWLLCGSLAMNGDDNLVRYRVGDLVYYVSSRTRASEPDRIRYDGHVFDQRDGTWVGYVSCGVQTTDKTSPGTPAVEAILSRLSVAPAKPG